MRLVVIGAALSGAALIVVIVLAALVVLNRRRWKTRIELATAIHDYIELFHNTRRRHSALGMLTPAEYETLHTTTHQAA